MDSQCRSVGLEGLVHILLCLLVPHRRRWWLLPKTLGMWLVDKDERHLGDTDIEDQDCKGTGIVGHTM